VGRTVEVTPKLMPLAEVLFLFLDVNFATEANKGVPHGGHLSARHPVRQAPEVIQRWAKPGSCPQGKGKAVKT
jgi:hypothetical protein